MLMEKLKEEGKTPVKEIHVTGRIAEKILSSDGIRDNERGINGNSGEVTIIRGVPIIKKNDSFEEMMCSNVKEHMRLNPTGREAWLREIKFIEE